MKSNFSYLIVLLLGVIAITFNSCDEKDDYNYNNIEPVIFNISGPSPATAHGNTEFPVTYTVPYRGGSSFNWTIGGNGGTFVQDEVFPSIVYVTFNQSSTPTSATITVTETTMGGKTSEPFSIDVALLGFCPYEMNDFIGDYTGTAPGDHAPTVEMVAEHGLNVIRAKGLAFFVPDSWGENWVKGDGSCVLEFGCGDIINIYPQWIGDTDYPDAYGIEGTVSVDVDNKVINLDYTVYYGWSGTSGSEAAEISTTLTLDGKMIKQTVKRIEKPNR